MDRIPAKHTSLLICGALTLLIFTTFGKTIHHSFINYDDDKYITKNPRVQQGLTFENIGWAFTSKHASNWHPITWLSHMLDCQLFGLDPRGHYFTNVLLHIANTLLLFAILKMMTGAVWQSAFVSALFAFHPLHVESVAWAAERKAF